MVLFLAIGPIFMFLLWFLTPKTPVSIAIIDKTVLNGRCQEHESFNWILKHHQYTKPDKNYYREDKDYFGFFPTKKIAEFQMKGLENLEDKDLKELANRVQMAYYTDTYGIYTDDTISNATRSALEHSGKIYGGLSKQDLYLLQEVKAQHKLIVCEFNCIASPTNLGNRSQFENMFGVKWSGWTGRYYNELDTNINKELPKWLKKGYLAQHQNRWPFKKDGIILVNENERIEILGTEFHLNDHTPIIHAQKSFQKEFGVVEEMKYPFWFDIMYTTSTNKAGAVYELPVNPRGDSLLTSIGVPKRFPAVLMHQDADYQFFYFAGDFCDNPIQRRWAYLKGIRYFSPFLYNHSYDERESFFWDFYLPMMSTILEEQDF